MQFFLLSTCPTLHGARCTYLQVYVQPAADVYSCLLQNLPDGVCGGTVDMADDGTPVSKRVRKTREVFEVPQGRQQGYDRERNKYSDGDKVAPLSVSQATPQHSEGLVPIDDFLGDSLFALEQLLEWSRRMRAGAAPSPALPDSNAPSCGEDGVLVLDRL